MSNQSYGFAGNVLFVDLTRGRTTIESLDMALAEKFIGGLGLTLKMAYDRIQPGTDALAPANPVVLGAGPLVGTDLPSVSRVYAVSKLPASADIGWCGAGGVTFGYLLKNAGYDLVVIEGRADHPVFLKIIDQHVEICDAGHLWGKGVDETYRALRQDNGRRAGVLCIGQAGENQVVFSMAYIDGIATMGRGGLGAVLGSKHLKFIVVDGEGAPGVEIVNKGLFDQGRKKLTQALREHAITKPGGGLNSYGTAILVNIINEAGGLPTRNFREGRFEGAAKTSGEAMAELCKTRGGVGTMGHPCHPGCIIQCSNVIPNPDGSELVSVIEYETTWAFGANCGIDDLDVIGKLTWMANNYGMDTIEAGGTIAVAMEAGLAEFGDGKRAIELMEEIGKGTPLGHILGQGAATTGKVFGVVRVPGVKGQNMPAYEPRAIKGIGMTYAISTMGADHTSGYTIAPEILACGGDVDQFDVDKAELVRNFQYATAFIDSTGHCLFIAFAILDIPEGFEGLVEECNGVLGTEWTMDDVGRIGKEILAKERAFNAAAGFTKADDRLPEFMKYEKLPPHDVVWDVPDETLDAVFEE